MNATTDEITELHDKCDALFTEIMAVCIECRIPLDTQMRLGKLIGALEINAQFLGTAYAR